MSIKAPYLIAEVSLMLLSGALSAQVYTTGRESKKADVNFTELANYYKAHPLPLVRKLPFDEDEEEENPRPSRHRIDRSKVHLINRSGRAALAPGFGALLPVSPAPNDTFLSTISPGTDIPPDTHGGVDSQYCVTAINSNVHIQTRTGANVSNVSLDGFWTSVLPTGDESFDPRVHYDPYYRRWILITDAVNGTTMGDSYIMIAVSATNDPTGTWHMFTVSVDATNATWLDFPCAGFNSKWLTVSGNIFDATGGGSGGAAVYVFNYADLMAGTSATYTKIAETSSFTLCPALTFDPTQQSMFAIEINNGGTGQLQLWKISGPVGSPTIASVGYPATTQHWHNGGSADFVPQSGSTNKIQAGDDRITNLTYRNHALWCAHTVFLPDPGTAARTSVMWWQIDTLANPLQNGLIDDPTTPTFFDYPSITVNAANDALLGFGYLSSFIHPSAAYALHLHTDPADSMRPPFVFRHGQATYYETFGGTQDRWGDYSATCVDPRNDTDFWTIQESDIVGTSPNWDTWWANVQLCDKPDAPTLAVTPALPCPGDTATYVINPIAGATSYTWIVSGAGWSGASTGTSITITAGPGAGTIGVLATNSCGAGETYLFTVTPTPLPSTPIITLLNPVCIGGPAPVFSATSGGATSYSWQALGAGWSGASGSTSFTPATVGTVTGTIICTTSDACGAGAPDTMLVTPAVVPTANFVEASHITTTLTHDIITYAGSTPAGSVFTWNFGGGIATPGTGGGAQTVYWATTGLKTITLTVNNGGCTATFTDTVLVNINVGVNALNMPSDGINIQPNPNDGSFDIVFSQQVNDAITVKVTDVQGRVVYTSQYSGTNNGTLQVATGNIAAGTYSVTISSDGFVVTKKITVVR
jgi:hypothetical protein